MKEETPTAHNLKAALIAEIIHGAGPLVLQRKLRRARDQRPDLNISELAKRLLQLQPPKITELGSGLVEFYERGDIRITTIFDEDYPLMLKAVADPPLALFYRGALQNLHRPAVSIVGARSCTHYGVQVTRQLAGELAQMGFVVVSGLAVGIDAHAHAAALSVGGRTMAVLGNGIDRIYPTANQGLADEISAANGTLISEFPPGYPPHAYHFPIRNRIISGLSHAVIVVEAKEKSGSLITARYCLDQGRELFAVPGPIHHLTSAGTNRLIFEGEARLLLSTRCVLYALKPLLGMAINHQRKLESVIKDSLARKIYDRLDAFEPTSLDALLANLQIETGMVVAKLTELESTKMVEQRPGQLFFRNPLIIATQE